MREAWKYFWSSSCSGELLQDASGSIATASNAMSANEKDRGRAITSASLPPTLSL
jgi:hypothetical protein